LTSHFPDGGYNVISRKKVLPPGEKIRSVCRRRYSSVCQFLIYSIFVLVVLIRAIMFSGIVNVCIGAYTQVQLKQEYHTIPMPPCHESELSIKRVVEKMSKQRLSRKFMSARHWL